MAKPCPCRLTPRAGKATFPTEMQEHREPILASARCGDSCLGFSRESELAVDATPSTRSAQATSSQALAVPRASES